jgi:integrase
MPQPLTTTHTLMYKELVLYIRPNSRIWQCRYKIDHKWQRGSTKEYKFDLACVKAKEMMIEAEIRKRNNLPVVTRKFKDVAKLAVERMLHERKANIGKVSYIDYMRVVERYLIPFFGNRAITNIDYVALDEFDDWRISIMGKAPTQSTLLTHNAALNRVFDEGVIRGYLTEITRPKLEIKGRLGERRPAFDLDELKILIRGFDAWIDKAVKAHSKQCRYLLRDYVFTLIDTGARPGKELFDLKWKQVNVAKDFNSVVMRVSGKTGAREMLGMTRTVEALRTIAERNYAVSNNEELKNLTAAYNSEYVFRTPNKINPSSSFQKMFESYLVENNLLIDPQTEQRRVFYSLRHTYATLALTHDRVPIHTLAQQMGTSVGMIEKHYSHLKVLQAIEQLRGEMTRSLLAA